MAVRRPTLNEDPWYDGFQNFADDIDSADADALAAASAASSAAASAQSDADSALSGLSAKKADSMSTNKLLGRGTAGTGVIEEITLGTGLSLTGTTLNAAAGGSSKVENLDYSTTTFAAPPTPNGILPYRGTDGVSKAVSLVDVGYFGTYGSGVVVADPANEELTGVGVGTTGQVLAHSATGVGVAFKTITQDDVGDGTTAKQYTATEKTKLTGIATGATANSSDATLLARANHTGTQSADTLTDGTTNKAFLATERTKLTGIASGATVNSTDATLKARANHTGTQAATTITGLATVATSGSAADLTGTLPTGSLPALAITSTTVVASQSAMLALTAQEGDVAIRTDNSKTYILSTSSPTTLADWKELVASGAVQSVNSQTGTVSLTQDNIGDGTTYKQYSATDKTKLAGVASGATANDTDANLKARANHTGTQSADTLTDGTTNKAFLATERTKLTGIATSATANSSDATLLARANHTGTQAATTITGLATVATSGSYTDLSSKPTIPVVSIVTAGTSSSGYPDGLFIEYTP